MIGVLRPPSLVADSMMWMGPETLLRAHLGAAGFAISRVPRVAIPTPVLAGVAAKDMTLRPLNQANLETAYIENPARQIRSRAPHFSGAGIGNGARNFIAIPYEGVRKF